MDTANLDLITAQQNLEAALLDPDPMTAIRACRALQELIAAEVDARAFDARQQGATWTDIGSALGMTKQAAQQRFGD
jgi:hypothetical protein